MKKIFTTSKRNISASYDISPDDKAPYLRQVLYELKDILRDDIELSDDPMYDMVVHCKSCDVYLSWVFHEARDGGYRPSAVGTVCDSHGQYPPRFYAYFSLNELAADIQAVSSAIEDIEHGVVSESGIKY